MGSSTISVPSLRAEFDGRVIAPGDDGYDAARTVFAGGVDRRPAAIVRPTDAEEVARVVTLARETGLELAVRSGGHSALGHGVTDGGILLDLAGLSGLAVSGHTAWAGTGLTAGEYTTAVAAHGLATGFGDTGTVGIGGITLGGGMGLLSRKYGLTIDDLLAAEVVTAGGQVLRADPESHPDLFWALRGGGGNFGVVTRLQFRLHELPSVVGGMMLLPATPDALAAFVAEAVTAPEELSTIAMVMTAPPMPFIPPEHHGALVILALMCYAGPDEAGERAIAPFRKLARGTSEPSPKLARGTGAQGRAIAAPLADLVQPRPYPEMYPPEEPGEHPTIAGRTMFLDTFDRAAAELVVDRIRDSDAPMRAAQLRVLGGAIARVPDADTAYAHRRRQILVNLAAVYEGAETLPVREAWLAEFADALLRGSGDTGAYVNFLGDGDPARVREAYPGPTWDRLRAVKARYDPTNLFRLNHNIPPA